MRLLHLYGQEAWHDEAFVIGNREGLLALRALIDEALTTGRAKSKETSEEQIWVSDGEGYTINIIFEDGDWDSEFWNRIAMPYSEDYASGGEENTIYPWRIVAKKECLEEEAKAEGGERQ
jgi:hypothetical protein